MNYKKYDTAYIEHFGIKGMRWGHRKAYKKTQPKEPIVTTTKYGDVISMNTDPTNNFVKFLAKHSPRVKDNVERSDYFSIRDSSGKNIGEMELYRESKNSMNVVWVGIRNDQRGKGYAQAAMIAAVEIAKKRNMSKVTLEVPGNSPDAKHIYSKLGFKELETISDENDVWGGLTKMELNLNKG